ncbi:CRISPR-associated helicase Cas3' [Actinopolyspora alba]|nr:CRISPR-associated helicase Cas3' [Actinopolyspora alba]
MFTPRAQSATVAFNQRLTVLQETWGSMHLYVWGKSRGLPRPYPLEWHLIDAAAGATTLWHMHLTLGARRQIATELGMNDADSARLVALLAGLHDVGKAIPCFQQQWPKPGTAGWLAHDEATHLALPTLLGLSDDGLLTADVAYRIGQLLGGHHGVYYSPRERDVEQPVRRVANLGEQEWHAIRSDVTSSVRSVLGNPRLPDAIPAPVAVVLSGVVIVADWLSSNEDFMHRQLEHAPEELEARYEYTVPAMGAEITQAGLNRPEFVERISTQGVWGFAPSVLQRSIIDELIPHVNGPGLLVITDSTGAGKTEAGLLAAHALGQATGRSGLYAGLPTMATANEMRTRLTQYSSATAVTPVPVTLAHSMAAFQPAYSADVTVSAWLRPLKRTLLAGISVGTIDQALVAALAARHNMLRLHGLMNKTLIVDEAHAYDPFMQALLARLLSWCGRLGVPVVLLSATLPQPVSRNLVRSYLSGAGSHLEEELNLPYPGWAFVTAHGNLIQPSTKTVATMATEEARTAKLCHHPHRRNGSARQEILRGFVEHISRKGGCLAVLCNTVAGAQHTYTALKAEAPNDVELILLHARFPLHERETITTNLTGRFGKYGVDNNTRPAKAIVVATQILEQSLDVDFDRIVSEIAPIAWLIQRLGRCQRHPLQQWHEQYQRPSWCPVPTVDVLDPVDESADPPVPPEWREIYSPFEMVATHRVLTERDPTLEVPTDVNPLVQQVHAATSGTSDSQLQQLWDEQFGQNRAQHQQAALVRVPEPDQVDDLARMTEPEVTEADVSTRLGVDTVRVIPQYTSSDGRQWLDAAHTRPWPTQRPNSNTINQLIEHSIPCPGSWADELELQPQSTWSRTPTLRDTRVLPAPTYGSLTVDPELGLVRHTKGHT